MKIYQIKRSQLLFATLDEAWDFFSNPTNLSKIIPPHMDFRVISNSGKEMYAGQIIKYKVKVLPGYTVDWVSEITDVDKPFWFVDEQRLGPYAMWRHQHQFIVATAGIEMIDEVNYAVPLGWIGRLANRIFIQRKLNAIFNYRRTELEKYFAKLKLESTLPS